MKLVVGLGNPGERYKHTPHNLGFLVIDELAKEIKIKLKKANKFEWGQFEFDKEKIFLMKPLTFMNLSGRAVVDFVNKKGINVKDMLVICDDINLPWGKIRIRQKGSDGGHLGLRSVIGEIKTQDFPRLRIGIGKPGLEDLSKYVLEKFTPSDAREIKKILGVIREVIFFFLKNGLEKTMSRFN
ncbi:MAG: aminoacyl-tRNA hydrolase [Candidatus Omnitrophica bacterium]|nr:aminoacyl-tRNA hydrolase [Candidatus Omnitrophota bacterium]